MKKGVLITVFAILVVTACGCTKKQKEIRYGQERSSEFVEAHPVKEYPTLSDAESASGISFTEAPTEWNGYKMTSFQTVGEGIVQITYVSDLGDELRLRKGLFHPEDGFPGVSGDYVPPEYGCLHLADVDIRFKGDSAEEIKVVEWREEKTYNDDEMRSFCILLSNSMREEDIKPLVNEIHEAFLAQYGQSSDHYYDSVTELLKECDENFTEDGFYFEAIQAYEKFLTIPKLHEYAETYGEGFSCPRFSFGYVDEDDVPELFIAYNSYHGSPVYVFSYFDGKVCLIGRFSTYGQVQYATKENRIISSYGNNGYFTTPVSQIVGDKAELVDCAIYGNGVRFYAGYPIPKGLTGAVSDGWEDGKIPHPSDEYAVSEEEYERLYKQMTRSEDSEITHVSYSEMATIRPIYREY